MRNTMVLGALLTGLLGIAGFSAAHDSKSMRHGECGMAMAMTMDPQTRLDHMTKTLDLTGDQVPQVEAILANSHSEMDAIMNKYTLAQHEEAWSAMQQVREQTHDKLGAVLTAEQMQKMENMRHHMHGKGKGRRNQTPTAESQSDE